MAGNLAKKQPFLWKVRQGLGEKTRGGNNTHGCLPHGHVCLFALACPPGESLVVKSAEDERCAHPLAERQGMHEDYAGEEDAKKLSCGHNCCEKQSAKLLDGNQNEYLRERGGEGVHFEP
jgi:hypothetical protein